MIAYVFYRSLRVFLVLLPLAVLHPVFRREELRGRRSKRLASEFREGITVLSSSIAAGFSFENAMKESETELRHLYGERSLIAAEFGYINHRVSMNVPIEKAWEEFALRSGSDDIRNFARVVRVAKRSGGELNSIIAHSADIIGDKIRIEDEILTMTAAKRLEQRIMNLVPVFIVVYIELSSPGFFDMMYSGLTGRVIMTGCLAVYLLAVRLSGKILSIEV